MLIRSASTSPLMSPAEARGGQSSHPQKTVGHGWRGVLFLLIMTSLLLLGLGMRLAYLQLMHSGYYRQMADTNRIRLIPKPPERGRILDRHGALVAGSQLSHSVYIWPLAQSASAWQALLPKLAHHLKIPETEIRQRLEQAGYRSPFPIRILRNISPALVIQLEELSRELPGVIVEAEAVRYYPNGDLAAHVLGYTGEISPDLLQQAPAEAGYRLGDIVGLMGVEELYEPLLRGQWGGQQVEVDAAGEVLQILGEQLAQPGQTLQLTLDIGLQREAEQALAGRKGAIVALDPRDGSILAMASYPTFDPNLFSSSISQEQWSLLQQQEFPFLNRSLRAYPPASTFKIITTAAALESGSFSPATVLSTAPYIQVAGRRFWDWNRAGFGALGFTQAMAWSSDTFFYQVAMQTTAGPIQEWSRRFGLGQPSGLGLTGEATGLVPDQDWKQTHWGEPWYVGDTVNMSIGQGFLTATPLQMALVTAAVANGGWVPRPRLSQQLSPRLPAAADPGYERRSVGLSPSTLQILQRGLREVMLYGTGQALSLPPGYPLLAGKSGTAEDPPRRSHAWFVSYAPHDSPEIVVVAFLENSGGGGSKMAGPLCRRVLQAYFQLQQTASP